MSSIEYDRDYYATLDNKRTQKDMECLSAFMRSYPHIKMLNDGEW